MHERLAAIHDSHRSQLRHREPRSGYFWPERHGLMNRLHLSTLAALLAASLLACETPPTIRANYDKAADLSTFQTYSFVPELGTTRAGYSSLVTNYFKEAIRREMESRGYRYVDSQPDLLVNFNTNSRENVDIRSTPGPSMGYYGYRGGMYAAGPMYADTEIDTVR